jgi:hypothetical protein
MYQCSSIEIWSNCCVSYSLLHKLISCVYWMRFWVTIHSCNVNQVPQKGYGPCPRFKHTSWIYQNRYRINVAIMIWILLSLFGLQRIVERRNFFDTKKGIYGNLLSRFSNVCSLFVASFCISVRIKPYGKNFCAVHRTVFMKEKRWLLSW